MKPLRFPGWLIGIPFALVIALFAVSNRIVVPLALWPLPDTLDAPIYLVVLIALFVGFVLGAAAAILSALGRGKK